MIISDQSEENPQAKLKPATARKFVKVSARIFLRKCQRK